MPDTRRGPSAYVYESGASRRVVDGRGVGPDEAWLLTVEARDAFDRRRPEEIVRISLETGAILGRWHAPPGTVILDIDWIASQ